MSPLITPGTWLWVEFGAGELRVGEIALFALGETAVAHRILRRGAGRSGSSLITKGDALARLDAEVPATAVFGVVRAAGPVPGSTRASALCSGRSAALAARLSAGEAAFARIAAVLPAPLGRLLGRLTRRVLEHAFRLLGRLRATPVPPGAPPPPRSLAAASPRPFDSLSAAGDNLESDGEAR
jgi:hypothetical protein